MKIFPPPVIAGASAAACLSLALAGCSATSGVSDELNNASLAKSRSAVAIMKMTMSGVGCQGGQVEIGRKEGDVFKPVTAVNVGKRTNWTTPHDVAQVELPAGEYHIVRIACAEQSGNIVTTTSLGKQDGFALFGIGRQFRKSYASFSLGPGEIVNLGHIVVKAEFLGINLTVADLPLESRTALAKDKPQLAASMVTRLMQPATVKRSPEEIAAACERIAKFKELLEKLKMPVPAECGGGGGAAEPRMASTKTAP